ncbi:MAG TPA: hypothetical protein VM846_00005 [Vicinamibacterales bacterium]|nr:hypothetical protein [Vicinamibacterales bacterium]
MIDGLKLTFSGAELRTLLDVRIQEHVQRADWWRREETRTEEDATEDAPLLPSHMCENEAQRHTWRSSVLAFIRDHVEADETYRLDAAALEFGELLPAMPGWLAQDEYEKQTAVGFGLERLTKTVDRLATTTSELLHGDVSAQPAKTVSGGDEIIEDRDEFVTTRVDTGGGPEVIAIQRK